MLHKLKSFTLPLTHLLLPYGGRFSPLRILNLTGYFLPCVLSGLALIWKQSVGSVRPLWQLTRMKSAELNGCWNVSTPSISLFGRAFAQEDFFLLFFFFSSVFAFFKIAGLFFSLP